jgi:hypothetical protein
MVNGDAFPHAEGPWSSLRRRTQRSASGRRGVLRMGARAAPARTAPHALPAVPPRKDRSGPRPARWAWPGRVAGPRLTGLPARCANASRAACRAPVPPRTKTAADPGRRATRAVRPSNSTTSPTRNCRPRLVSGSPFTRTSPAAISSLASEPVSARSASFRNCPSRMDSSRMGTSTGLRTGIYGSSHGARSAT